MSICVTCGSYYRKSVYNDSAFCESCSDDVVDSEYRLEMDLLQNPSGRVQPVFYDDTDDQS